MYALNKIRRYCKENAYLLVRPEVFESPECTKSLLCSHKYFTTQTKEMTSSVTPYVCSKHPLGPYRQHPGILHPAPDSRPPLNFTAFSAFSGYTENQNWVEPATFTTTTTQTAAVTHFIG